MIFYFSSTGNTAWAAQEVASAIGEKAINIAENMEKTHYVLSPGERIGFCFPVYGWRPASIMLDFVSRLNIENAHQHYTFLLCTTGDTTGEALKIMSEALSQIGIQAHDWFSLLMPESYVGLPFMDVDTKENEKRKIKEAQKELQHYLSFILAGSSDNSHEQRRYLHEGRWPRINSRVLGWFFYKYLVNDRRFHVKKDDCRRCGLCKRLCPVNNIDLTEDKFPLWKGSKRCMTCFSCYHHCPTNAIAFGRWTKGKGQYFFNKSNAETS